MFLLTQIRLDEPGPGCSSVAGQVLGASLFPPVADANRFVRIRWSEDRYSRLMSSVPCQNQAKKLLTSSYKYRETDRQRQTETETESQTDTKTQTDRQTDRHRQTQTDRELELENFIFPRIVVQVHLQLVLATILLIKGNNGE